MSRRPRGHHHARAREDAGAALSDRRGAVRGSAPRAAHARHRRRCGGALAQPPAAHGADRRRQHRRPGRGDWRGRHAGGWWTPVAERSAVLVSHIANGTADPDFDGTLREAVTVYLAQSPYLDLVSDERIRGTLQLMGRKPRERMTHEVAAELCQRLGLQAMLEGSVSAVGRTTVVALAATDCHTGATIARQKVEVSSARKTSCGRSGSDHRDDPRGARRIRRIAGPQQHADRGGDDAVAGSAEGLHRRRTHGGAAGQEVDAVSFSSARSRSIRGSRWPTRRCRASTAASARPAAARSTRGWPTSTASTSASASGSSSPTSTTTASPAIRRRRARRSRSGSGPIRATTGRPTRWPCCSTASATTAPRSTEAEEAMQRNPMHAFPRSNLAYALRGAGRYAEARAGRRAGDGGKPRDRADAPAALSARASCRAIAALAQAQIDWAANQRARLRHQRRARPGGAVPRPHGRGAPAVRGDDAGGDRRAGFRRWRPATPRRRRWPRCSTATARRRVERRARSCAARPPTSRSCEPRPRWRSAASPLKPRRWSGACAGVRPQDTLLQTAYLPVVEAAALLARGEPAAAIEQLRRAAPLRERHRRRAAAGLRARRGAAARRCRRRRPAREFQSSSRTAAPTRSRRSSRSRSSASAAPTRGTGAIAEEPRRLRGAVCDLVKRRQRSADPPHGEGGGGQAGESLIPNRGSAAALQLLEPVCGQLELSRQRAIVAFDHDEAPGVARDVVVGLRPWHPCEPGFEEHLGAPALKTG